MSAKREEMTVPLASLEYVLSWARSILETLENCSEQFEGFLDVQCGAEEIVETLEALDVQ